MRVTKLIKEYVTKEVGKSMRNRKRKFAKFIKLLKQKTTSTKSLMNF